MRIAIRWTLIRGQSNETVAMANVYELCGERYKVVI
jgi:hypothetical protein